MSENLGQCSCIKFSYKIWKTATETYQTVPIDFKTFSSDSSHSSKLVAIADISVFEFPFDPLKSESILEQV